MPIRFLVGLLIVLLQPQILLAGIGHSGAVPLENVTGCGVRFRGINILAHRPQAKIEKLNDARRPAFQGVTGI
jgi:hypothetical protein